MQCNCLLDLIFNYFQWKGEIMIGIFSMLFKWEYIWVNKIEIKKILNINEEAFGGILNFGRFDVDRF